MTRRKATANKQQMEPEASVHKHRAVPSAVSFVLSTFRAFVISLPFLLIMLPVNASVLTSKMKTPYFVVRYDPTNHYLAETTADTAQDELRRVSRDLDYEIEPNRPFPLMVYRTHLSFIQEGGLKDRFTVGTAQTGDERISVDASGAFVTMKQVLGHEITHAVVFRLLGPDTAALPLWMNEGLAKYESEQYFQTDDALVADAASNTGLIPLADLRAKFPTDRTDLAYAESASAARYMVKRYGKSAPGALLAELAATGSFDKAMRKVTGKNEDDFVSEWTNSLSKRFALMKVFQIGGACGGALMAMLAVWAFVVRRRRMAEAARQWEWEQFEESMERQLREWPHR